jgi:hypothetical protein
VNRAQRSDSRAAVSGSMAPSIRDGRKCL